ncbi:YHS domain-containing (seleno)protein [Thalassotalea marina]|uniref:YHS domain-containing protein n=1 Tax=Thalassotalea marina TaxID=1673741 RepID=A0A919BPR9_9GAMM|nr:YHS domain-containing (seleno)protein [Thalassotalea marina]GHG05252.1 hypothetical protein GCM10017161_38550 [Thalassotalea marina]
MKLSTLFKSISVAGALAVSSLAFAVDNNINVNANDLAIHGYDPVAYFTKGAPTKGSAKYSATHEGAIYYFSSTENRDKFKANPTKFAPQFGGYCAMGIVLNQKLDTDPSAWYIDQGKLYLNLNKTVQKKWMEDVSGNIQTADRTWNGIEYVPAQVLADQ